MKARGRDHDERELERGRDFFERIIHDAGAFGEENVHEVDEEWAEFEKALQDFRDRRLSATSDEKPQKKKQKRVKKQAFYPSPASFSEADQYEYSSDDEDESVYDADGYKTTLVRTNLTA